MNISSKEFSWNILKENIENNVALPLRFYSGRIFRSNVPSEDAVVGLFVQQLPDAISL